jgi:hypothetical protein
MKSTHVACEFSTLDFYSDEICLRENRDEIGNKLSEIYMNYFKDHIEHKRSEIFLE